LQSCPQLVAEFERDSPENRLTHRNGHTTIAHNIHRTALANQVLDDKKKQLPSLSTSTTLNVSTLPSGAVLGVTLLKGVTCHQCRNRKVALIHCTKPECGLRYCEGCLQNHYHIDMWQILKQAGSLVDEASKLKKSVSMPDLASSSSGGTLSTPQQWTCPHCFGRCTCITCKRTRGETSHNQAAPVFASAPSSSFQPVVTTPTIDFAISPASPAATSLSAVPVASQNGSSKVDSEDEEDLMIDDLEELPLPPAVTPMVLAEAQSDSDLEQLSPTGTKDHKEQSKISTRSSPLSHLKNSTSPISSPLLVGRRSLTATVVTTAGGVNGTVDSKRVTRAIAAATGVVVPTVRSHHHQHS